jgi:hypothetical protein
MSAQTNENVDIKRLVSGVFVDDWMVKTGVGGMFAAAILVCVLYSLSFLSFTLLPLVAAFSALTIGYCLRCMRLKATDPEAKLPPWNEWGDLFMSGITWIALQTGIWLAVYTAQAIVLTICLSYALNEKSLNLSYAWTILGCGYVSVSLFLMFLLTSYLMVNFAIEENVKAGLAYVKVVQVVLRAPVKLVAGFLLASGIQCLAIVIPCLTVVGVFLAPSACFIGSMVSSIVLARHWCACNDNPNESASDSK